MFADRTAAGERLADRLESVGVHADVVIAIPRGGLPLGRAVADGLDAPLDVVVATKIGAPNNPELAIGAVGSDGSEWLNADLLDRLGVSQDHLDRERRQEQRTAREKERSYRAGRDPIDLDGKRVVLVDDGVATGATVRACLRQIRDSGAASIVLAVPVGPPDTLEELRESADRVVALRTPAPFGAVGRYYRSFDQVSDEEARGYLTADSRP